MWKGRKGKPGLRYEGPRFVSGGSREYYGCEVCWTCKFYHMKYFRCYVPVSEGSSIYEFVGIKIKNPEWYRCYGWEPKNEYKK